MKVAGTLFVLTGICLLLSLNATYLGVVGPVAGTLQSNQTLYLGRVGPGESFYVIANSSTTNASGVYVGPIGWDTLQAHDLPAGWSSQASPLYAAAMKTKITVSPNAQYGLYKIQLNAINVQNYSRLGNLTVYVTVNVTPNVLRLSLAPSSLSAGIGQPANLYLYVNNTGISDEPLMINAVGLPAWNLSDEVISLHDSSSKFTYPVFENEPGVYKFNLTVASTTSSLIRTNYPITLTVRESILNDFNAVGNGISLSPMIFEPAYAFMSLLAYLYSLVAH